MCKGNKLRPIRSAQGSSGGTLNTPPPFVLGARGSCSPRAPTEEPNLKGKQMKQTTNAQEESQVRFSNCPPARKPQSEHATSPSVLAEHQGGRVRAWLYRNAWLVAVAIGWVFFFAKEFAPEAIDPNVSAVLATAFFGFGIGWIVRSDCDGW